MNARARYALMACGWALHPDHATVLQKDGIDVGFWVDGSVDVTFPVGDVKETIAFPAGTPGPAIATFCAALHSTEMDTCGLGCNPMTCGCGDGRLTPTKTQEQD